MLVSVIKNKNDISKPDMVEIETLFKIGQEIKINYDLNKSVNQATYGSSYQTKNHCCKEGNFKITNIFCNMLVYPHENMIEIEAQDEYFKSLYPSETIMLVFEDVLNKRLVE